MSFYNSIVGQTPSCICIPTPQRPSIKLHGRRSPDFQSEEVCYPQLLTISP